MQPTPEALAETYAGKSEEELRSLHAMGTLTQVANEALERELQSRGVAVPARPEVAQLEHEARKEHARTTLAGHWKGKAPLASAYWLVGTLGFWLVYGAAVLTKKILPILMPVAWAVMVAFLIFAWVSIWRCWRNTRWPAWGYVARGMVVMNVVLVLVVAIRLISEALERQSVIS
jgi:hypothetical protein